MSTLDVVGQSKDVWVYVWGASIIYHPSQSFASDYEINSTQKHWVTTLHKSLLATKLISDTKCQNDGWGGGLLHCHQNHALLLLFQKWWCLHSELYDFQKAAITDHQALHFLKGIPAF